MQPNIKLAQQYFDTHCVENGDFCEYGAAYAVTNEDLRHAILFVRQNAENALVVAGSGDHPMFTALRNVKHIDTFDITYNAKLIMDIKTAALKVLNHKDYCKTVLDLFSSKDIAAIDTMTHIIEKLPIKEQEYIAAMRGHRLFCHGLNPLWYKNNPMPTIEEYNKMRSVINKPFDFIWSDITQLSAKLTKKYDFIHLSNIMEYMDEEVGSDTIISLLKHTRPGSTLCFQSLYKGIPNKLYNYCQSLLNKDGEQWKLRYSKADKMLYVMDRIR